MLRTARKQTPMYTHFASPLLVSYLLPSRGPAQNQCGKGLPKGVDMRGKKDKSGPIIATTCTLKCGWRHTGIHKTHIRHCEAFSSETEYDSGACSSDVQMLLLPHSRPHTPFPLLTPASLVWFYQCLLPDSFLFGQPCKCLAEIINELDFLSDVTV